MGIFDSITSALGFGDDEKEETQEVAEAGEAQGLVSEDAAPAEEAPAEEAPADNGMEITVSDAAPTVDIVSKLDELSEGKDDLDWKESIVDLMELVGLDSSYAHRKELAEELGIDGYSGTAEQNIELHKTVLRKLAENGGNVPEDLLA